MGEERRGRGEQRRQGEEGREESRVQAQKGVGERRDGGAGEEKRREGQRPVRHEQWKKTVRESLRKE